MWISEKDLFNLQSRLNMLEMKANAMDDAMKYQRQELEKGSHFTKQLMNYLKIKATKVNQPSTIWKFEKETK